MINICNIREENDIKAEQLRLRKRIKKDRKEEVTTNNWRWTIKKKHLKKNPGNHGSNHHKEDFSRKINMYWLKTELSDLSIINLYFSKGFWCQLFISSSCSIMEDEKEWERHGNQCLGNNSFLTLELQSSEFPKAIFPTFGFLFDNSYDLKWFFKYYLAPNVSSSFSSEDIKTIVVYYTWIPNNRLPFTLSLWIFHQIYNGCCCGLGFLVYRFKSLNLILLYLNIMYQNGELAKWKEKGFERVNFDELKAEGKIYGLYLHSWQSMANP